MSTEEGTKAEKKHTADEEKAELIENIKKGITEAPLEHKARLVAINNLMNQKKTLDEELEVKLKELTLQYEKLSLPIIAKQNEIATGQRLPVDEELNQFETFLKPEEKEQKEKSLTSTTALPTYWLKALKNCSALKQDLLEKDEPALEKLIKIEYIPSDQGNIEIIFHFDENEYFTNKVLSKKIILEDDEPKSSVGTKIEWKDGAKRVVEKEVDDETFFNFFNTVDIKEEKEEEEEEGQSLHERLDIDYDIARTLVDEVVPYSLEYYLNVKVEDEEEDFEDDEAIDEEEDDDEVEEIPKKGAKKVGKKTHKKSGDSESGKDEKKPKGKEQECKQQ